MAASPVYFRTLLTADAVTPEYLRDIAQRTIRACADR
ncbi:hypothetical protein ACNO8X_21235 [Mycobacterium sp. PDNC021]